MRRHHQDAPYAPYDVYDDTVRRHARRQRAFARRHAARRDPMVGMMERLEADMFGLQNSLLSSMRGMTRGMMQESFNSSSHFGGDGGGGGGSTYVFESHSRTVGPDGRVYEERVHSAPGSDGHPRTVRTVRNPDGTREETTSREAVGGQPMMREPMMGIFGDMDFGWPFGGGGRGEDVPRLPPTSVEEIPDEEDGYRRRQRRYRRSGHRRHGHHGHREEPIVEEPDD